MSFLIVNRTAYPQTISFSSAAVTIQPGGFLSKADGALSNLDQTAVTQSLFLNLELYLLNADGSAYTGLIPDWINPAVTKAPQTVDIPVSARALIAKNTTASISLTTSPAPVVWTAAQLADSQFDLATGVITFAKTCTFNSVFYSNLSTGSGTTSYYTDAETSVDGGTTWVRGTDSMRQETVRSTDNHVVRGFAFAGRFLAGTKLRFVHWASSTAVTLTTDTVSGSTAPALRLTYNSIPATFP